MRNFSYLQYTLDFLNTLNDSVEVRSTYGNAGYSVLVTAYRNYPNVIGKGPDIEKACKDFLAKVIIHHQQKLNKEINYDREIIDELTALLNNKPIPCHMEKVTSLDELRMLMGARNV